MHRAPVEWLLSGAGFNRATIKWTVCAKARVYLDSNVYKFAATELSRVRPRQVQTHWGGRAQSVTVHDIVVVNPNAKIPDPNLKAEAELLLEVAALSNDGLVGFVIGMESQIELAGLPDLDSQTGHFFNADREIVQGPVGYGRILFGGNEDFRQAQYNFLQTLTDQRFGELQRMTGAYQGAKPVNRNQLLDAYHLWCAEHNNCDFVLSLDFKLARVIEASKHKYNFTIPVVRPSQLLTAVRAGAWSSRTLNNEPA